MFRMCLNCEHVNFNVTPRWNDYVVGYHVISRDKAGSTYNSIHQLELVSNMLSELLNEQRKQLELNH